MLVVHVTLKMVKSKTNDDQVFGEIDGHPKWKCFDNSLNIKNKGLHKYKLAHKGSMWSCSLIY